MSQSDSNMRKVLVFIFRSTRTEDDFYTYTKFKQCNTSLADCFDYCIDNNLIEYTKNDTKQPSFDITGLTSDGMTMLKSLLASNHK